MKLLRGGCMERREESAMGFGAADEGEMTSRGDLLFYSDRIIRLLVEGLNHLPVMPKTATTATVSACGSYGSRWGNVAG